LYASLPEKADVLIFIFKKKAQHIRDAKARDMVGRLIKWAPRKPYSTWGKGPFVGQLEYVLDRGRRPRPLVGIFPQGRGPAWDVATAEKLLLPEDSAEAALVSLLTVSATGDDIQATTQWNPLLTSKAQQLTCSQLASSYQLAPHEHSVYMAGGACRSLREALCTKGFERGLDVWWGEQGINGRHSLASLAREFRTNAMGRGAHYQGDPLSIRTHAGIHHEYPADLYIIHCKAQGLDCILPLAYAFTQALVCALVPASFLLQPTRARAQWLDTLASASLLRYIRVPGDKHAIWLLMAKTTAVWGKVSPATAASIHLPA
jgi:hypothetical protein